MSVETQEEIRMLRSTYPDLIHSNNVNEDNWYCDVCLDTGALKLEGEEPEELVICELCMVTLHPSCYRRELFTMDPEDESPWFC